MSKTLKNPLNSARGPLGLWYCKIYSLNEIVMNILKIMMGVNGPKKL